MLVQSVIHCATDERSVSRYRQFFELDTKLKERFPGFQGQLPKKKVSGNMAPDFVNERKRLLSRPAHLLQALSLAMRLDIDDATSSIQELGLRSSSKDALLQASSLSISLGFRV